MQKLLVNFEVQLKAGQASTEDINYITDRMQHCPDSSNLKTPADAQTLVKFSS